VIGFTALEPADMERIVDKFMIEMQSQLAERKITLHLAPEARTWLARKGYDPAFGARPLARLIQEQIKDELTREILFGTLQKGGDVTIYFNESALSGTTDSNAAADEPAPGALGFRYEPARGSGHSTGA